MSEIDGVLNKDTRIMISIYCKKEKNSYPNEISRTLSMPHVTVYDRLKTLEKEGKVTVNKRGRNTFYSLTNKGIMEVEKFLENIIEPMRLFNYYRTPVGYRKK